MLIGEATLKTANYCRRLTMLLDDLRALGCTVWLAGLRVRFDVPESQDDYAPAARLDRLMSCYSDIVSWLPLCELEPSFAAKIPAPRAGFFSFRRARPLHTRHD